MSSTTFYPLVSYRESDGLCLVTRISRLDIDECSLKFNFDETRQVNSDKEGEYVWKIFSGLEFKAEANIQFGGILNDYASEEEKEEMDVWAQKFLEAP